MTIRVTTNMLSSSVYSNLNRNSQNLLDIQSKISSGKEIRKPSDDPVGTASAIRLRAEMSATTQFLRNIESGETQLTSTDGALTDMSDLLMRAQELAVGQANVTADDATREAVAEEVNALINQMVDLLNTKVNNRYIFAGFETTATPYVQTDNGVTYTGDSGDIALEIDNGTTLSTNVAGSTLTPSVEDDLGGHANLFAYTEKSVAFGKRQLVELNEGSGVDQGLIRITNMAGKTAVVDVSGADTVEDVAYLITNATDEDGLQLRVTATVDADNQSLTLTDTTSDNDRVPGQRMLVEEVTTGRVARQLGLIGKDTDGDGVIEGRGLAPIDLTTNLAELNNGSGVEKGKFQITDREGNSAVIDISQAVTITDVRDLIDEAGINVRAVINSNGSGIMVVDETPTSDVSGSLAIVEYGTNTHTAEDLGILTPENGVLGNVHAGDSLSPVLTRDTAVSMLNRGTGIDLRTIMVENGSNQGEIDLSQCATVGEIIDTINSAGLDLKASINDLGTGISVTSNVGGRTLKISNGSQGLTATQLNIAGSRNVLVDPVDPVGSASDLLVAVDGSTRLGLLNGGDGVDTNGSFRITDSEGNAVYINIFDTNTLQGVINKINELGYNGQGVVNVEARISDDLKGITIIDHSVTNTTLERATSTGSLSINLNDLEAGDTIVLNTFDYDGVETASYLSQVDSPSVGEQSLTGTIETISEDGDSLTLRAGDGTLYEIVSDQSFDNLFVGQQLQLNGEINPTGEFEARSFKVIDGPASGEEQISGTILSVDNDNSTVTIELPDGSTRTVDLITDRGVITIEDTANSTAAADLGIAGTGVVGSDRIVGDELNAQITGDTDVSLLQGGTFEAGRINIQNGNRDVTIDLSGSETVQDVLTRINNSTAGVVATINEAGTGIAIQSKISGTTLVVNKVAETNPDGSIMTNTDGSTVFDETADLLGISGSNDILGNLYFLKNSLLNNSQEDIQATLDSFTESLNRILNQQTKVGARTNQLTATSSRGEDSNLRNTEILSGIEDIDVIEAANDLTVAENAFNAALSAASSIITNSLLDYL